MNYSAESIALLALIPMVAAIIGGLVASYCHLKDRYIAALQHFVAGIVIGAVSIELLPEILSKDDTWSIAIGFFLGATVMISTHALTDRLAEKGKGKQLPLGLITGSSLDLLIDGMLIGISLIAGIESALVIAISLSFCAFFLNMSVSSTLTEKRVSKGVQLFTITLIAFMLPVGTVLGAQVVSKLSDSFLVGTISFGVSALLFLGVEELLVEAHKKRHDAVSTSALFFLGFLIILFFRT